MVKLKVKIKRLITQIKYKAKVLTIKSKIKPTVRISALIQIKNR